MLEIFNNLSVVGKSLIIVLIFLFIALVSLIIYLCIKSANDNNSNESTDFFDDLKKEDNTKSVYVDNVDIDKANEIAVKIEPTNNVEEKKDTYYDLNLDSKPTEEEKFDIGKAAKQMEVDIENSNIDLTEYEVEQEEKAIISYKELLNKVKQNQQNESNVKVNVQTVDLEPPKEEFNYNTEILDFSDINDTIPKEETSTLFKQDDIKEMLSIKDIDSTIYSSDAFLKALKDLRDSLD